MGKIRASVDDRFMALKAVDQIVSFLTIPRARVMRTLDGLSAPSASLLHFLRCQLREQSCNQVCSRTSRQAIRLYSTERLLAVQPTRPTNHDRIAQSCARWSTKQPAIPTAQRRCPTRPISTSSTLRETFWRRMRTEPRSENNDHYRSEDLPPLQSAFDDSPGLGGRITKPSNDLKLRCTEFDEGGNVVLVNGEFRKHELVAKYSLLPRDLRKIDSSVLPHILVRPSAILLNLLHIRCLIKYNRVLVFDVYGSTDSYAQSLFMYDLEGKLRQKQTSTTAGGALPYEFRALEAVLISVTTGLESEFEGVRDPVMRVLRELEEDIDRDKLRHLLVYSKKLSTFEQRARLVRDAIDNLLEEDDDLQDMYLTEKAQGVVREEDNHEEVELLLESYHKVADEIVQISSNLVTSIKNTEEIIRAILDANRNALMLLDLKFSILTLGTTVGMFIAALYGMNLENFIEETSFGFAGISGLCTVLAIASTIWGLRRLRKVQKVRMWGDGGSMIQPRSDRHRLPARGAFKELEASGTEGGSSRGLGEAVTGIKGREAIKQWRIEQAARAKQLKMARQQAAGQPVVRG